MLDASVIAIGIQKNRFLGVTMQMLDLVAMIEAALTQTVQSTRVQQH